MITVSDRKNVSFWMKLAAGVGMLALIGVVAFAASRAGVQRSHGLSAKNLSATSGTRVEVRPASNSDRAKSYGNLPLNFEENVGQTVQEVRFVAHGSGYELFLTPQEAVVSVARTGHLDFSPMHRMASLRAMRAIRRAAVTTVRLHLDGANPAVRTAGMEKLPVRTNYFVGNDPTKWHTGVATYARVKYSEIYPGVDLVFYGNQHRLEYDFVVAPGADPGAIAFSVGGARKLRINSRGDLVMSVAGGEVELQKPVVYQQTSQGRQEIAGGYELAEGHRVRFAVAKYDRSAALIVDPILNYSTYLGGTSDDQGASIAVDAVGDAFVTGTTFSVDFPTTATAVNAGPLASNANGTAFVTEMNPAGTAQLYSTYLGGSGGEEGFGIALDATGNVYVTGSTFSTDFPTTANALKGGANAGAINGTSFLTKINPLASGAASLVYSSYIGGTSGATSDAGEGIAVDATGNAYVTGITGSLPGTGLADFPATASAFQGTPGTGIASGTGFLTRIDTTKSGSASLIYSTFLGGNGADAATLGFGDAGLGVAVDLASNAYIVGTTSSTNFPTSTNALQVTAPAAVAKGTVFVARIDTTMSGAASRIYATYLGGNTSEFGNAIALGPNNVAYVTGNTGSPSTFPTTPGAFQTSGDTLNPNGDAFISLIDTTGTGNTSLKYSTYLGDTQGSGDVGFGIKADIAGNAYVGGASASAHFPVTKGAFEPTFPGAPTGFITKLNPAGGGAADLVYSTYFGGSGNGTAPPDQVLAIAIDLLNNAYVTGGTSSAASATRPFPISAGAFQTALKGTSDAFVSKLTLIPTVLIAPTSLAFGNQTVGVKSAAQMATLTNNASAALSIASVAVVAGSPAASSTDFAIASGSTCVTSVAAGANCTLNVTFTPSVTGAESATLVFTDGDASSPQSVALTGTGTTAAAADFSLSAASTLTIAQGATGSVTVTMTPVGGFTGTVALACTGAPTNSTCSIAPTSVASSNGTATATATVTVMTHSLVVPANRLPVLPISMLQIVSICFAGLAMWLLSKSKQLRTKVGLAGTLLMCVVLAGCGGDKTTNPPTNNGGTATSKGTTTLTITGTSGSLSHTATVSLTVN